jgi:hypothetical protein
MLVGVGADVMPVGDEAADEVGLFGVPEKIAGEEKAGPDVFLPEDAADGSAAVGEVAAGEDQGHFFPVRPAAYDPAFIAAEYEARVRVRVLGSCLDPSQDRADEQKREQDRQQTSPSKKTPEESIPRTSRKMFLPHGRMDHGFYFSAS